MKIGQSRGWALAVGGVMIGLLAGCGGADEPTEPSTTPSATTPPATPPGASATTSAPAVTSAPAEVPAPTVTASEVAPSVGATPSDPVSGQGFAEGVSYWTFADNTGSGYTFAAYGSRVGDSMCLIRIYPEYLVEVGTLTDTPAGQEFAIAERAETMLNPYVPPYTALVTGDPASVLTLSSVNGDLVLYAADMATAATVIEQSNPGTDGMEVLSRVTGACG